VRRPVNGCVDVAGQGELIQNAAICKTHMMAFEVWARDGKLAGCPRLDDIIEYDFCF